MEGFAPPSNFVLQGKMKLPNLCNRDECNAVGFRQVRTQWLRRGINEKTIVKHFCDSLESYVTRLLDSRNIRKVELNEL